MEKTPMIKNHRGGGMEGAGEGEEGVDFREVEVQPFEEHQPYRHPKATSFGEHGPANVIVHLKKGKEERRNGGSEVGGEVEEKRRQ